MNRRIGTVFSVLLALLLVGAAAVAVDSSPPAAASSGDTIDLDLSDVKIDGALKTLFSGQGLSFVLEPSAVGMVKDVHVKDVPFDTALKAVLRSVDPPLTYRKDKDVYYISVKKEAAPVVAEPAPVAPVTIASSDDGALKSEDTILEKIMLNFMDAAEIKAMIEGQDTRGSGTAGSFGGYGGGVGGFGGFGGNSGFGGGGFGGNSGFGGFGGNSGFGSSFGGGGYGNSYGSGYGSGGYGGYGGVRTGF